MAPDTERLWTVPELGPSLGRLVDPSWMNPGALRVAIDDIRLGLVTGVFDLAGAARSFASAGDRDGAVASLGRVAWLGLWEKAATAAAERIAAEANARLRHAAEESRFPPRRLARLLLTDDDIRAVGARLGSGGAPFVAALDALEQAAYGGRVADPRAWRGAVGTAARRLEAAWLGLEEASRVEQDRLSGEIARVRAWRRPTWPLWIGTAGIVAAAAYLGLVLGGYLPVPPALQGLATFWWTRL